jgi:sec-independent protein translocase protein TatB
MLGLDWTELALIAVVAVVVIGPKDLPEAVRGIAKGIQKLRAMAGQFQGQLDEVVREAKLEDVRNQINEIRNFDFRSVVEKEIDKDGSIRKTFTEDPIGNPLRDAFEDRPAAPPGATVTPPPEPHVATSGEGAAAPDTPPPSIAPAFVPPGVAAATPPPIPAAPPQAPVPVAAPPAGGSGPAA